MSIFVTCNNTDFFRVPWPKKRKNTSMNQKKKAKQEVEEKLQLFPFVYLCVVDYRARLFKKQKYKCTTLFFL